MPEEPWSRERVIADLRGMKARGEEPNIYELKERYGLELLSHICPLLRRAGIEEEDLFIFVQEIFSRVKDHRDLGYILGECRCPDCLLD